MSDAALNKRDRRGDWRPADPIAAKPLFVWPPKPAGFLTWLFGFPGFLWPWNLLFLGISVATWLYLTPPLASMQHLEAGWIAFVFGRNLAMLVLFVGAWHLHLYVLKNQGDAYKFTTKPFAKGSDIFTFRNQLYDNIFWTVISGVPIWTAYEVLTLWAFANHVIPFISWETHPVWFAVVLFLIPIFRDFHFYLIHRLIHWKPLYRTVHHLHHRNVNVGPWSGLSMHPVEHLLYFSGVLIHWIVPSHPIHAIFHLQHLAFSPALGHTGYDRFVVKGDTALATDNYYHYLHHKYFECNYGGDGTVPFDKWFGTLHDGSDEALERMNQRFMARR